MEKLIIEVGSTSTKIDYYNGKELKRLETVCIFFKKNYQEENKLKKEDVKTLIEKVQEMQEQYQNIYVCGTSIFRSLTKEQKEEFVTQFQAKTNLEFHIISSEEENELTVIGATQVVEEKVAVFIGGGGSTEIAIYDQKIQEMVNTQMGVVDIMNLYPDLWDDKATTNIETVKNTIKEKLNLPKQKADILILTGGGHEYFARNSGFRYQKNDLYQELAAPICMDIETRKEDSKNYYTKMSLDEIKNKTKDPNWWYATRAMCAFVLVVAEEIGAKYIVPTDISMAYGLLKK